MSEVYVVWSQDPDKAQARLLQITQGRNYRVLRRDRFALIQAEDIDVPSSLGSGSTRHAIVIEVE